MDALHGHGHSHGQGSSHPHGQGHIQSATPATEGRLIRWAKLYDGLIWLKFLGQARKLRALPVNLAAIKQGERVLDVGCGTGDVTLAAARRTGPAGAVYGIDAATEMIEVARRKARRMGRNVKFQVEAVEALSFEDGSFDVVLSSLMMHHLPGDLKQRALNEIRRVLKPGGRLVIVDIQSPSKPPRPWEPGWMVVRAHGIVSHTRPEAGARAGTPALVDLLREAGFETVEHGTTRYDWIGYVRGQVPEK